MRFGWSHGGLDAGNVAGRRGTNLPPFSILISEALEADLGLAPVEKSVQNMVYHRNRVLMSNFR